MVSDWRDSAAGFATLADSRDGLVLSARTLHSAAFQWLSDEGLVEPGKELLFLNCPACRTRHPIEKDDTGHFMVCAQGVERLPAEKVVRWQCHWRRLGEFLNRSAGLDGSSKTILQNELSELGLLGKPSNGHLVLLARGLDHPGTRQRVFRRLAEGASWTGGVLISATRLHAPGDLPNGIRLVWLGDMLMPDHLRGDGVGPALWASLGRTSDKKHIKRGRPAKPGDPLATFLDRVRSESAKRKIGLEAAAIHKAQTTRLKKSRAQSVGHIENLIRPAFHAWREAGFPREFDFPD